jgi:hypothetical protein
MRGLARLFVLFYRESRLAEHHAMIFIRTVIAQRVSKRLGTIPGMTLRGIWSMRTRILTCGPSHGCELVEYDRNNV